MNSLPRTRIGIPRPPPVSVHSRPADPSAAARTVSSQGAHRAVCPCRIRGAGVGSADTSTAAESRHTPCASATSTRCVNRAAVVVPAGADTAGAAADTLAAPPGAVVGCTDPSPKRHSTAVPAGHVAPEAAAVSAEDSGEHPSAGVADSAGRGSRGYRVSGIWRDAWHAPSRTTTSSVYPCGEPEGSGNAGSSTRRSGRGELPSRADGSTSAIGPGVPVGLP